jgi:hypothetical protein
MARRTTLDRTRQLARTSPFLSDVLDFVFSDEIRDLLMRAADARQAPISAISDRLIERFGRDAFTSRETRQFAGLATAACLGTLGYSADGTRVRIRNDAIFETGSLFLKTAEPPRSNAQDLLARFVASLTDAEALVVADLLDRRRICPDLPGRSTPGFEGDS